MATDSAMPPTLGFIIRMRPLKPSELPSHPTLASQQTAGSPPLKAFISSVLEEGQSFMTDYLPSKFKVKSESKQSPPSAAPVELLAHEISAHDIPEEGRTMGQSEVWFARTSVHENAAKAGTATWEEFDGGLRADHSKHESEYTPDVLNAHKVLDWNEELQASDREAGDWRDVDASLMEMVHNIPFPLNNRVFAVLVITARKEKEFIVVQIPVDMKKMEHAKYAKDPKTTTGMYCSIERGEVVEGGAKVRWQMATASDAKGFLPMFLQKLGVPGAVVKDVGLFIGWCEKRRAESA